MLKIKWTVKWFFFSFPLQTENKKPLPVRVVPPPGGALAAMSSHLRLAHSNRNIRLTPAKDFTVWSLYLKEKPQRNYICIVYVHAQVRAHTDTFYY